MTDRSGVLRSVQVGRPREFEFNGQAARSAIWKAPVAGPVKVQGVNLEGDDQADRQAHGGRDKAVYAYALEDLDWWRDELGHALEPGVFGENLTTTGLDISGAQVGARWAVGTTILEVSEPRVPCWRLGVRMGDKLFPRRFTQALRPGAYLRIIREGVLQADDRIEIISRPSHGLTVQDVFRIYSRDRGEAERMLGVSELSDAWRHWAQQIVDRSGGPVPRLPS